VGKSEDKTLKIIQSISDKKIRIIQSIWNDKMNDRGYVYGHQKMIAQFNCSGDWAFYVEGDEIYHEDDLNQIKHSMEIHLNNQDVEALVVDFNHFYGNANSVLDSPGWYRSEARIIKNSIRSYAPDGLFWLVLDSNRKGRYPKAKKTGATCYHYGWVRSEQEMNLKSNYVQKYWGGKPQEIDYSKIDQAIIKEFHGTHPKIIRDWLPKEKGLFLPDLSYKLNRREKKHRLILKIEKLFGIDLSKKHFRMV
jgi:hypothetical protein